MRIGSTVYLRKGSDIGAAMVAKEIQRLFPNYPEPVRAPVKSGADNILVIGKNAIAILVFDVPQPSYTLKTAYKLNFIWPEARDVITPHRSHIVLSVIGEASGFGNVTAASQAMAVATLALANLTEPLAVFWDSSKALLKYDAIAGVIATLSNGSPPLDLWVTYSPWVDKTSGEIGLFSIGLKGFVGYDIEFPPRKESLGQVLERAIALTGYLLDKGPILKDGDTIGYSETERLKVKFADDGQSETVLQITTEQV